MGKAIDIIGLTFGKLKVIKRAQKYYSASGQSIVFFECNCDCSKSKNVRSIHLRRGKIQSCGNCDNKLHGESKSKLYRAWNAMLYRVKPNYIDSHIYFDKGITVCDEWRDYKNFAKWAKGNNYKYGLQLDRIDNSKGYSPDNCRFVKPKENCNNRDVTVKVVYKNVEYAFTELIDIKGLFMYSASIRGRIARGWSIEDAFDKPIRQGAFKRKYFNNEDARKASYKGYSKKV